MRTFVHNKYSFQIKRIEIVLTANKKTNLECRYFFHKINFHACQTQIWSTKKNYFWGEKTT